MNRHTLRGGVVLVATALMFAVGARGADAHTFLVRTSPQPGARLTGAPDEVVLDFTEPVAPESTIALRDGNGDAVELLSVALDGGGFRLRASLPPLADGVYQATWNVVADDGHTTEGEFVFAVGVGLPAGAVVTNGSTSDPVRWTDALAAIVLLGGLAIALGGLLSERFVWSRSGSSGVVAAPVTGAISIALGGAVGGVALILRRADLLAQPARWAEAFTTRADRLTLAITVVLSVGLLLVQLLRNRLVGLVPVVVAGILLALRGHGPEASGWWSSPAAVAHLLVGGAWIGALIHLSMTARANRSSTETIEPGPSRYATAALVAALATLVVGPVVAFGQLQHFSDLTGTRYGQILLVKLALVGLALAAALVARRRGIPADGDRIRSLARYTTIEAMVLVGVLAASALLSTTAPARGSSFIELGPAPLPKPTTLASDLAGSHQVLVAAAADRLQVLVLPPGGQPSSAQTATFEGIEPDGTTFDLQPRPCGPGCFDIAHHWLDGITRLTVAVTNPDADGGSVQLEIVWPPGPDATDLLTRAIATTSGSSSVTVTENVSSGPSATTGPGDLIVSGADYIGASPFNAGADDVHQQPDEFGLRAITFAVSGAGTWHKLWIDETGRIRRETLVDPGHRIDRILTYPDNP